tara:strand:- start:3754 stop:4992 length:1239 start_codon:yes stop_codon:yes gene_type:complete
MKFFIFAFAFFLPILASASPKEAAIDKAYQKVMRQVFLQIMNDAKKYESAASFYENTFAQVKEDKQWEGNKKILAKVQPPKIYMVKNALVFELAPSHRYFVKLLDKRGELAIFKAEQQAGAFPLLPRAYAIAPALAAGASLIGGAVARAFSNFAIRVAGAASLGCAVNTIAHRSEDESDMDRTLSCSQGAVSAASLTLFSRKELLFTSATGLAGCLLYKSEDKITFFKDKKECKDGFLDFYSVASGLLVSLKLGNRLIKGDKWEKLLIGALLSAGVAYGYLADLTYYAKLPEQSGTYLKCEAKKSLSYRVVSLDENLKTQTEMHYESSSAEKPEKGIMYFYDDNGVIQGGAGNNMEDLLARYPQAKKSKQSKNRLEKLLASNQIYIDICKKTKELTYLELQSQKSEKTKASN